MADLAPASEQVVAEISAILERTQRNPNIPVGFANFFNDLRGRPGEKLDNCWLNARLKAGFFRRVESRFLISFPQSAYDRNWDFNQFCDWVADRAGKPEVNLKLANKHLREDFGCLTQLFVTVGFFGVFGWLNGGIGPVGTIGFIVLPIILALIAAPKYLHNCRIVRQLRRLT